MVWFAKPRRNRVAAAPRVITWKDPVTGPLAAKKIHNPRYVAPEALTPELAAALIVGAAVIAKCDLDVSTDPHEKDSYPFSVLRRSTGHKIAPSIIKGSLLIYAGTVRVKETTWENGDVRVIKHTFITPVGRCIIHELRWLVSQ